MEHETVEPIENPETGIKSYPWMTSVEDCDCDSCLARYER